MNRKKLDLIQYSYFGSIFVPGQPTSVRLHRARHPSRARSKIEPALSSSILTKRTRIESSSKSVYRARLAIELKVAFLARSTNRARKVIELGKVGNSDFSGVTRSSSIELDTYSTSEVNRPNIELDFIFTYKQVMSSIIH